MKDGLITNINYCFALYWILKIAATSLYTSVNTVYTHLYARNDEEAKVVIKYVEENT